LQLRAFGALLRANLRYWISVTARVHRELRRWQRDADAIPDPVLRRLAVAKLEGESFNTEVAATLATLAPRRHRRTAIEAIVPLQVMYDYLDGLGEEPSPDPLADGFRLFAALAVPFASGGKVDADYYALHPHREDGGYLASLAAASGEAFRRLPNADAVAPIARRVALCCGEAQTRTHSIEAAGLQQLVEWSTGVAEGTGLSWWECTAGATAAVLTVHALIAAAADPRTEPGEAEELERAYLYISAVSTLLDSLIDQARDATENGHSFVAYYQTAEARVKGVSAVVARAAAAAHLLRNGPHHCMTTAGVAGYYLSAPAARLPVARPVKMAAQRPVQPLVAPILGIFRLWRLAKGAVARRR
jgi:tetraprenyl-beta-curcumene synthase